MARRGAALMLATAALFAGCGGPRGLPVGAQERCASYQKHDYPAATLATVIASGSNDVECWVKPFTVTGCGKTSAAAVAKVVLDSHGHVQSTRFVPDPCPPESNAARVVAAPSPTDADSLAVARGNARNITEVSRLLPAGSTRLGPGDTTASVRYRVPGLTKRILIDIWHREATLPNAYGHPGIAEYKESAGPLVVADAEIAQRDGVACDHHIQLKWRETRPDLLMISASCDD